MDHGAEVERVGDFLIVNHGGHIQTIYAPEVPDEVASISAA